MRIHVLIDDALMRHAAHLTGLNSKKAVIEAGVRLLIQIKEQEQIRKRRGKLKWTGNLEKMRADR
ncbi:MAG: type II toxin-antitoxin system VapB family antitoxin [Betaproteobacteria bacterium]|nr:type II toxin-antitoxin system VapB family antitoxin [Betaproteobacteria bacterium]